jgi:thioredoxin reductase (NADPH)
MVDEHVREVAVRRLSPEQHETLRASGRERRCTAGAVLLPAGACDAPFFVIDEGRLEAFEGDPAEDRFVAAYGPGGFTGDIDVLSGKPSLLTVVAATDATVHELPAENVRSLIRQLPWLGDVLLEAFSARRRLLEDNGVAHAVRVIGSRFSGDTTRIRQFLARNLVPFTWVDIETDEDVDRMLRALGIDESQAPVVEWDGGLLHNPSNEALADALGRRTPVDRHLYDVAIIGAGPAGLAAAVYAASEGLDTIVLEQVAPGGQAGCSSRIENYLGFPSGISGAELTNRAMVQAYKFGAKVSNPSPVIGLDVASGHPGIQLANGERLWARSVVIASGVQYRLLDVEGRERFDGAGVYYTATQLEAPLCEGSDAVVVGAGNSAGQAAVYLAERARRVFLVVRGADLDASMSRYLAWRIQHAPAIEVLTESEVVALAGDTALERVTLENRRTGERREVATPALFSMIGAVPRTEWLPDAFAKDGEGFVQTGTAARRGQRDARRAPYLLETSVNGVFAAGDVRAGSSKRVAAAVGEGSMAIQFVHQFLDAG